MLPVMGGPTKALGITRSRMMAVGAANVTGINVRLPLGVIAWEIGSAARRRDGYPGARRGGGAVTGRVRLGGSERPGP